jgi:hypothetical protein
LTPFNVEPVRMAIGMAICADCAVDRSEIELAHAAVLQFRAGVMPGLRVVPAAAMAQAGHA